MHGRKVWGLVALGAIGGAVTLSLSWGQDRSPAGANSSSAPMTLEVTPAGSTQGTFASRSGPDPSKYNALEVDLRRSFAHGLQFRGTYTWSKNLDNVSAWNTSVSRRETQWKNPSFLTFTSQAVPSIGPPKSEE